MSGRSILVATPHSQSAPTLSVVGSGVGGTLYKCYGTQKSAPPGGTLREVVIIGDNNVGLMAATVGEVVAEPNAVEIIYSRNTSMAEAVKYATEYQESARYVPRQYILHAGLQDVIRGNPDEMTSALDSMPTGRRGT